MTEVDKSSSGLTAFPDDIPADCVKLELYANKIKKVPPSIGALKNLSCLNVFNNLIGLSLPEEIGTLTELEEVNVAANKLAMLKDAHFASWGKVQVLNLNDNNLSAIGSLAPLVSLAELRVYGNQLGALPTLAATMPELKIFECHKNRIESAPDDYFKATPALESLSIWQNQLSSLPSSLAGCKNLLRVQAHENKSLASLPEMPSTLETLFVQDTALTDLPKSLTSCALKRVNITGVKCDEELAKAMQALVLSKSDGIFWGTDGKKQAK